MVCLTHLLAVTTLLSNCGKRNCRTLTILLCFVLIIAEFWSFRDHSHPILRFLNLFIDAPSSYNAIPF